MTRRIPPAEATEHPWWTIIDPARLQLPHPDDVGGLGPCPECGALAEAPCVQAAEEDSPGARRSPHDGRPDYRSEITSGAVAGAVIGVFFSRDAAEGHLRAKRHRYGEHARVWCMGGAESREWQAFCNINAAWAAGFLTARDAAVGRIEAVVRLREGKLRGRRRGLVTAAVANLGDIVRQIQPPERDVSPVDLFPRHGLEVLAEAAIQYETGNNQTRAELEAVLDAAEDAYGDVVVLVDKPEGIQRGRLAELLRALRNLATARLEAL